MPTTSNGSNRSWTFWLASSLSLQAALSLPAAQTAEDYFHQGATNYVFEQIQRARQAVKAGLAQFPEDRLLIALDKLLNPPPQPQAQQSQEQQNQQQQSAAGQQNQTQDQSADQNSSQAQQSQTDSSQQQPDKPQLNQGSAQPQPQQAEDQAGQQPEAQADQPGQDPARAAKLTPGQMTPDQAHQLLDRHRAEERLLLFTPPTMTNRLRRPLKDW
jgi:hypothetical protein